MFEDGYLPGDMLSADNVNAWIDAYNDYPEQNHWEFGTNFWKWFGTVPTYAYGASYPYQFYEADTQQRIPAPYHQDVSDLGNGYSAYKFLWLDALSGDAGGYHDICIGGQPWGSIPINPSNRSGYITYGIEPVMAQFIQGPDDELPIIDNDWYWGHSNISNQPHGMQFNHAGYRPLGQYTQLPNTSLVRPIGRFSKFARHREWQCYYVSNVDGFISTVIDPDSIKLPNGSYWLPLFNVLGKRVGIGYQLYPSSVLTPNLVEAMVKVRVGTATKEGSTSTQRYRMKAEIEFVKANFVNDGYTGSLLPNVVYSLGTPITVYFGNLQFNSYAKKIYELMYSGWLNRRDLLGITVKFLDDPPPTSWTLTYGLPSIRQIRQSAS